MSRKVVSRVSGKYKYLNGTQIGLSKNWIIGWKDRREFFQWSWSDCRLISICVSPGPRILYDAKKIKEEEWVENTNPSKRWCEYEIAHKIFLPSLHLHVKPLSCVSGFPLQSTVSVPCTLLNLWTHEHLLSPLSHCLPTRILSHVLPSLSSLRQTTPHQPFPPTSPSLPTNLSTL